MSQLKFSVITVTKNSSRTVARTIKSVLSQSYIGYEHIIKDGISTDNTKEIILSESPEIIYLEEHDNGIYDAMNQGVKAASGDIVSFLNSDDYYIDTSVFQDVSNAFNKYDVDFVYGNVIFFDSTGSIKRYWKPGGSCQNFLNGNQIPHPAFFVRRSSLVKLEPVFDSTYKISADLKQQLILINMMGLKGFYLNRWLAAIEVGGASTRNIFSYIYGWLESIRAYNDVFGSGGTVFVIRKVFKKLVSLLLFKK